EAEQDQSHAERYHREIDIAHPSEEQEMTEQQRERGRQQNGQRNCQRAVAKVYRRNRMRISTKAEEGCVAEAENADITPRQRQPQGSQPHRRETRKLQQVELTEQERPNGGAYDQQEGGTVSPDE